MNTRTLFAAAALALLGTTAIADEVRDMATPSTLTRAEVRAELDRARADHELDRGESYGAVTAPVQIRGSQYVAGLSRVEVRRDLARTPNAATIVGESYGTVVPGQSLRSREAVRAEAITARVERDSSPRSGS
jgi:Domain of unknown function (DUF4148)